MALKKKTVTVSLTSQDEQRISDLASRHPLLRPHRVAQVALRLGLDDLVTTPTRLDEALAAQTWRTP